MKLILIEGDKNLFEQKFIQLIARPHMFEREEFESLIYRFHDRLTYGEKLELIARRLRHRKGDRLAQNILLAIIEGRHEEFKRLMAVLHKRNKLGLRMIENVSEAVS